MFEMRPLSNNRLVIFDLLNRSKNYHASVTGVFHWDVTDTLARIERDRERGRDVGFAAYTLKATSLIIAKYPKLNSRLFHRWFGLREVIWKEISCNLIVSRKGNNDEDIILPVVIRNTDQKTIEELHQTIRDLKKGNLQELPSYQMRKKIRKIPRIALRIFDYLVRTRPKYYIDRFGTFNLSAIIHYNSGGVAGSAISPSTTFYPTNIEDRPHVHNGEIAIRKVILFGICVDHYLVDGLYSVKAMEELKELIENPETILGPETE
jgi:pyruvate/2-oxoglutarate dehydrogenase complex dihydrolipoamide acyltransferase (E2) component